jgi:hypothetical protein
LGFAVVSGELEVPKPMAMHEIAVPSLLVRDCERTMSSLFLSFTRLSWTVIYASMPSVETTSVVKVHAPNGFDIEFVLASG